MDAATEMNPKNLRDRVRTAERAVLSRVHQIENSQTENSPTQNSASDQDETLALNEALKSLRYLRALAEWF